MFVEPRSHAARVYSRATPAAEPALPARNWLVALGGRQVRTLFEGSAPLAVAPRCRP
ncbi:MAG: hypothetical protein ACOY99_02000 [Pseudomonadota bacterium]